MRTIIIGMGEVGKALYEVLSKNYSCVAVDIEKPEEVWCDQAEIMHICFPYSDKFIEEVKRYREKYKPLHVVIHSTVPMGTSIELGSIDSPIIGIHPHLAESLKVFTKFLGGKDADKVADYFRRAGIKVYTTENSNATELMKFLDTTFYGLCIEYTKEVKKICKENNIPFELWTLWTENYNKGYQALGYPEYTRPNLVPIIKRIGGHCILPNLNFLKNDFTELIKKRNEAKEESQTT